MRLVRAEERVAAKMPAVTSGPKPEIISITCTHTHTHMTTVEPPLKDLTHAFRKLSAARLIS